MKFLLLLTLAARVSEPSLPSTHGRVLPAPTARPTRPRGPRGEVPAGARYPQIMLIMYEPRLGCKFSTTRRGGDALRPTRSQCPAGAMRVRSNMTAAS